MKRVDFIFVGLIFFLVSLGITEISTTFHKNNPALTGELFGAVGIELPETVWTQQIETNRNSDRGQILPVVAHGKVFYWWLNNLVCRDAFTGNELWSRMNDPAIPKGSFSSNNKRSPSLFRKSVLLPSSDGKLLALDTADGTLQWTFSSSGYVTNPNISGDTLYITDDKGVVALNGNTGKLLWRADLGDKPSSYTAVAVADGYVYYGTGADTPESSEWQAPSLIMGYILKVEIETQKLIWKSDPHGKRALL